jgi:hypothetical protein
MATSLHRCGGRALIHEYAAELSPMFPTTVFIRRSRHQSSGRRRRAEVQIRQKSAIAASFSIDRRRSKFEFAFHILKMS